LKQNFTQSNKIDFKKKLPLFTNFNPTE